MPQPPARGSQCRRQPHAVCPGPEETPATARPSSRQLSEMADGSSDCSGVYASNMTKGRLRPRGVGPNPAGNAGGMVRLAAVEDKLHSRPAGRANDRKLRRCPVVAEYWLADPQRALELQKRAWTGPISTCRRMRSNSDHPAV